MACYGDLVYVGQHDTSRVIRYWRSGAYDAKQLESGWMPPHPTLYVRRELYEKIGGFNTRYRITANYDCILRLFRYVEEQGGRVEYLPQVLVKMRTGGASNRSLKNIIQKSKEDLQALRTNQVGGLGVLALKNFSKLGQFFRRDSRSVDSQLNITTGKDVRMKQQLLDYFKDACQKRFGDELIDIKVSNSVPHQAFVQIVVKVVTPEITALRGT